MLFFRLSLPTSIPFKFDICDNYPNCRHAEKSKRHYLWSNTSLLLIEVKKCSIRRDLGEAPDPVNIIYERFLIQVNPIPL